MGGWVVGWGGGKMNPRIRLTSAKVEIGVEVEAELGNSFFDTFIGWVAGWLVKE